jgi:hypothetical protein
MQSTFSFYLDPASAALAEIAQDTTALFEQYEPITSTMAASNDDQYVDYDACENLYALPN